MIRPWFAAGGVLGGLIIGLSLVLTVQARQLGSTPRSGLLGPAATLPSLSPLCTPTAVWEPVPSPNGSQGQNFLLAATALSPNNVWAAGYFIQPNDLQYTLIEHWNGTAWTVVADPAPPSSALHGIAARTATDIWAIGSSSNGTLIEHWNGAAWSIVPSPNGPSPNNNLMAVAPLAANDVWAIGYGQGNFLNPTLT